MARVGIAEAAARLGLSVDSVRRRVRKGELTAKRDNKGVWQVDVPDDAVPMQRQDSATLAPAYAVPMQTAPDVADGWRELVGELRARVADLLERLDLADRRADAMEAERGRLLALVERLSAREGEGAAHARAEAAERRAAELQGVIDGELARLRAMVGALAQREQTAAVDSRPAPESHRTSRRPRRGLLGLLLGR